MVKSQNVKILLNTKVDKIVAKDNKIEKVILSLKYYLEHKKIEKVT